MPAVTQADYARRKDVSPAAISKAIKTGKISPNKDGLIETDVADAVYSPGKYNGQLTKAKTVRETYLAKKAKLDYEKSAGLVLDAGSRVCTQGPCDSRVFRLPDRLYPQQAGATLCY